VSDSAPRARHQPMSYSERDQKERGGFERRGSPVREEGQGRGGTRGDSRSEMMRPSNRFYNNNNNNNNNNNTRSFDRSRQKDDYHDFATYLHSTLEQQQQQQQQQQLQRQPEKPVELKQQRPPKKKKRSKKTHAKFDLSTVVRDDGVDLDPNSEKKKILTEKPIASALLVLKPATEPFWELGNETLALVGLTKLKCTQFLKQKFPNYKDSPQMAPIFEKLLITALIIAWVQSHYTENDWIILEKHGKYAPIWFENLSLLDLRITELRKQDLYSSYAFFFNLDTLWIPEARQLLSIQSNTAQNLLL